MSFRKQMYLSLIVLSLLPVLIISGFAMYLSMTAVVESRKASLLSVTDAISHQFDYYMSVTSNNIRTYSKIDEVYAFAACEPNTLDYVDAEKALVDELLLLVSLDSNYTGAFIMDENGTVTASTFPAHEGTSYTSNEFFARALGAQPEYIYTQAVISNKINCVIDGAVVFSTPVTIGGRTSVFVLASNINVFNEISGLETSYKTGNICLYDSEAQLLYHQESFDDGGMLEECVSETAEMLTNIGTGKLPSVGFTLRQYMGKNYTVAYSYFENNDFLLKLVVEESEIYSTAYILFVFMIVIIVVMLMIVTSIANRMSKSMMTPLIALQEAFDRAGNSRIYAPCTVSGPNEFTELANCFNNMMDMLNKKQEATEQALAHLRISEDELKRHNSMLKLERDRTNLLINRDSISGVYSRVYFERALDNALKSGRPGAVIFIDIDNFKHINDSFSHDFGDKCLKELGLAFSSDELEHEIVARISADEFMILKYGLKDDATECASRIFNILQKPFIIDNISVKLQGSIGVTLFPQDGDDVNVLLKNADLATNQAKLWGKNQYCYYHPSMTTELKTHMDIMEMLRTAHLTGDVYLVYQPEIDLASEQTVAFETLCRAKSEKLGFVTPAEFIPLAESSGLIVPLGEWILKNACAFAKSILNDELKFNYISVNVSQVQLNQENFVDFVFKTLDELKYPAHKLQLEITESALAGSTQMVIKKLRRLHSRGVRIALDDFGTGYSSLNYLVQLPIDTVKIDKSFIDHLCTDEKTRIMCDTIIKLGHKLGLHIVAEGTETEEQVILLKEMGCDIVQGYYYSRPVGSNAAAEYARKDRLT